MKSGEDGAVERIEEARVIADRLPADPGAPEPAVSGQGAFRHVQRRGHDRQGWRTDDRCQSRLFQHFVALALKNSLVATTRKVTGDLP